MDRYQQPFSLIEAVTTLLSECEFPASLTIEQCVNQLGMSNSSFRRRLAQDETSYKHIQSKFLNELCVQALLTKQVKIDDLAIKLGYAERATFERAFHHRFGLRPSQFRNLAQTGNNKGNKENLVKIAQSLPPMPETIRLLLHGKEQNTLDIEEVIKIIEKDPIFVGRLMGLASRAIYGYTPRDLKQAIARNLGINTVINLAIVYALKDTLQKYVEPHIIDQCTEAFLIAPIFYQQIRQSASIEMPLDIPLIEQILTFSLIGIFLLSHKETNNHLLMAHSLRGIDDFNSLNTHVKQSIGTSIYSASSLMLSLWHIDAGLIKQLSHLDNISQANTKGSEQDELILFMLSCLYAFSKGNQHDDELENRAKLLKINNFADIKTALFNAD